MFWIDFVYDYKYDATNDILSIANDRALFLPWNFAPGVWIGSEGMTIKYKDKIYKVIWVDLVNYEIGVELMHD